MPTPAPIFDDADDEFVARMLRDFGDMPLAEVNLEPSTNSPAAPTLQDQAHEGAHEVAHAAAHEVAHAKAHEGAHAGAQDGAHEGAHEGAREGAQVAFDAALLDCIKAEEEEQRIGIV